MRDINTLHPIVRQKALLLKDRAQSDLGLRIIITECLRTNDEQKALYAQGRLALDDINALRAIANMPMIGAAQAAKKVTKAKTAEDTWHGYGLAFDIAITDSTGRCIEWSDKSDWNGDNINDWLQVGQLAVDLGIEWGGNWTSFPDMPHYQITFGLTIAKVKAMPEVFAGQTINLPELMVA